jgi:uncharacterized membrane protein YbhN (UPF0104 family)
VNVRPVWALRLIGSAAILTILLVFVVPFDALTEALFTTSPGVIVAAVALFLSGHVVAASKWRLLMHQPRVTLGSVLRAHFSGLVANLCLPSVTGGDVVRAIWVIREVDQPESVAVASVADRGVDVLGLLVLAGGGWLVLEGHDRRISDVFAPIAGAVTVGVAVAIVAGRIIARRPRSGLIGRLVGAVRILLARPRLLLTALVLSIAVQAMFVSINAWLGAEVGVEVSIAAWFVAWPLAKLIALVPISLGGIGVREAALVGLLTLLGAAATPVMATGLLWELVLVVGGMVGWLVLTGAGRETSKPAQAELR